MLIEKIKLNYSKPINPQYSSTNLSKWDKSKRIKFKSKTLYLDKQIGIYNMWFRFLKLGLELEELKYKVRGVGNEGKLLSIKVNRKFYKSWDLDKVLTMSFDKWLSEKRDLFYDDDENLKLVDKITDTNKYYYVEINKNLSQRKLRRLVSELSQQLPTKDKSKTINYFTPKQQHKYPNLHIYYNLFLWSRTLDIRRDDYVDFIKEKYSGYYPKLTKGEKSKGVTDTFKLPQTPNSIRRCLRRGEEVLLDVCKGSF